MISLFQNTLAILTKAERKKFIWLTTADILISLLDIASLALLVLIAGFYSNNNIQLPAWLKPNLFQHNNLAPIIIFFIFFCIKNIAGYFVYSSEYYFAHDVASRISRFNLLRFLEGKYSDYVNVDSSVLIRRISLHPLEFSQNVLAGFQQIIRESALILFTVVAILIFNAKLFLILLLILLPPLLIANWLIKRKLAGARNFIKSSRPKMFQHVQEAISGYVESNLYQKIDFFTERYAEAQQTLNRHQASVFAVQGLPARLAEIFAIFGLLALIGISFFSSGNFSSTGFITLGAFLASAYKIIPGVARILNFSGQAKTFAFTVNDIDKESKQESFATKKHQLNNLSCTGISFSSARKNILSSVELQMKPGDFVGVTGDSGQGKTTLVNILLGFLQPDEGEIKFNDQVTTSESRKLFWDNISLVKQQPFVIHDSILTNITLQSENADEKKLNQVIEMAGLSSFIKSKHEGADFILSEDGKNISGGQRQRIAFARALYKDADLLILDEPFSELDEESERKLLELLKILAADGKMILLITHNRESLKYCTKTLTIEQPATSFSSKY